MSESRNDEFEVTMSGKSQDKPKAPESLSGGFRKIEKLGNKAPKIKADIPSQITDTVSADKAKKQNTEPVREIKTPVLNITKQIQTNRQEVRTVKEENNHSEKKEETEKNKAGEATPKEKHNKKNNGSSKNKGKIIAGIVAAVVIIVAIILLWPCEHEWVDATCTTAKTCSKCDAVEGEPLGHSWKKATCTKPSECKRCRETEGKKLGHKWKETVAYDYINDTITRYALCDNCNTKEKKDTTELDTLLHNNGTEFRIPPVEFMRRLNAILEEVHKNSNVHLVASWSGQTSYLGSPGIDISAKNGDVVASLAFVKVQEEITSISNADKDKEFVFDSILLKCFKSNELFWDLVPSFTMACDPKHDDSISDAEQFTDRVLYAQNNEKVVVRGDLLYNLIIEDKIICIEIIPAALTE